MNKCFIYDSIITNLGGIYIFNIFKKKIKTKDIVNPIDNINIEEYKDLNIKEKELVDNLIKEYKTLFKENNSIIDIAKDIYNNFKMYQELIINIISNLDTNNTLDSIISLLKLKVYLDELTNIYNTLKYKLISLNQLKQNKEYIRKETLKYYLGKRKLNINNSLSNLINNISLFLVNTYTLINIVNKEIINLSNIAINTNLNDYSKDIKDILNKIDNHYNTLFNNKLNIENNLTKLILEEIELEKFTYLNKDKKQELLNKLDEISNTEIKSKEEQQEIINNLMTIKKYFNIFNNYGRNIIKEEELNELYRIIFNTYTYFKYDCNDFIKYYNSVNIHEWDYYNKIMNFKIEMLKQGKAHALNNINNQDKEQIKELLLKIMNDGGYEYDYIHNELPLLLCLEEENGLENYFKNINVDKCELDTLYIKVSQNPLLNNVFFASIIRQSNQNTKYNIYKLFNGLYEEDIYSSENNIVYNNPKYKIFKIIYKNKLDFNIIPDNLLYFPIYNFANYLNKCDNDKPLIIPDTIKDIKLGINAEKYNFPCIKLPINLENLTINLEQNINSINIIMPLKINECTITPIPFRVSNLIFRKEILYMNIEELTEYLKKIYLGIIINIKESQNYSRYTANNKINNLNVYLNKICIEKDNETYEKLAINYNNLKSIDIDNIETSEFIDKVITCIIDCINNYKKGIYKKYLEPKQIFEGTYIIEAFLIKQRLIEEGLDKKLNLPYFEIFDDPIDIIKVALANNYNDLLNEYYYPRAKPNRELYKKE